MIPPAEPFYDVAIVGAGPAGLSAAVVLARATRRVVLFDSGRARNWAAHGVHNFISRENIPPLELRRLALAEAEGFGVRFVASRVESARVLPSADGPQGLFELTYELDGRGDGGDVVRVRSRKLLLATGVADLLPPIDGLADFYGAGVHHCPYCDAYSYRGGNLVAYGRGSKGVGLALALRTWSDRVTVCTNGPQRWSAKDLARIGRNGLGVRTEPIARVEGEGGRMTRIVFASGEAMACDCLFFNTAQVQRSQLPRLLGCEFKRNGGVRTDDRQRTCVRGLYLAGDAHREVQFAVVAAAEGAVAGVTINRELQDEDRGEAVPESEPAGAMRERGRVGG